MRHLLVSMSMLSLLSIGAIFGFFYAWVCSTMWGLDATDPRVAITAMQAMNGSVRNPVFFPAFFLTPFLLAATSCIAWGQHQRRPAVLFGMASGLYVLGAFLVTATVNVPMNDALAEVVVPTDTEAARSIWQDYSSAWQVWNSLRTLASGVSLLLTGLAIYLLKQETA
jgi:uncharacterized membrane protein